MNKTDHRNTLAIQRLTALWALSESGLGGLCHAFKIPFSGLLLGGIAVIIISLLCHFSKSKWKVVSTALILVLIVKGMVSPHTNITGYIAVSFQAITGVFFYKFFPFRIGTFLFCIVAIMESAFQKLIVLTLLYGSTFWEAINETGAWIVNSMGFISNISSSQILVAIYTGIYLIGSIFIGYIILYIIGFIKQEENINSIDLIVGKTDEIKSGKKKNRKIVLLSMFIILAGLVIYGTFTSDIQRGVYIFLRTLLILFLWFVVVGPFLVKLVNKYLLTKQEGLSKDIEHIFDLFPYLRSIIIIAWKEAQEFSYLKRWKEFLTRTIVYSLYFKTEEN